MFYWTWLTEGTDWLGMLLELINLVQIPTGEKQKFLHKLFRVQHLRLFGILLSQEDKGRGEHYFNYTFPNHFGVWPPCLKLTAKAAAILEVRVAFVSRSSIFLWLVIGGKKTKKQILFPFCFIFKWVHLSAVLPCSSLAFTEGKAIHQQGDVPSTLH